MTLPQDPPHYSRDPFLVLAVAEAIVQGRIDRFTADDYAHAICDLGTGSLPDTAAIHRQFAFFRAAQRALLIVKNGLDGLRETVHDGQTDDAPSTWDYAAQVMGVYSENNRVKRVELWQWWIADAIDQAWAKADNHLA